VGEAGFDDEVFCHILSGYSISPILCLEYYHCEGEFATDDDELEDLRMRARGPCDKMGENNWDEAYDEVLFVASPTVQ